MLLTAECHSRRSESDLELVRQSISRSLVSKLWLRTLAEPMDSFPTVLHRMLPSLSFLVFFFTGFVWLDYKWIFFGRVIGMRAAFHPLVLSC